MRVASWSGIRSPDKVLGKIFIASSFILTSSMRIPHLIIVCTYKYINIFYTWYESFMQINLSYHAFHKRKLSYHAFHKRIHSYHGFHKRNSLISDHDRFSSGTVSSTTTGSRTPAKQFKLSMDSDYKTRL